MKKSRIKRDKAKKTAEKRLYTQELNNLSNLRDKDIKKMSIFVALIAIILFSILLYSNSFGTTDFNHVDFLTGMAVVDLELESSLNQTNNTNTIEEKIENNVFLKNMGNSKVCLIVPYNEQTYWSYEVIKSNGETSITKYITEKISYDETTLYCGGLKTNDLTLSFGSYNSFIKQLDANSYTPMKAGIGGNDFYILPSSQIEFGGNVICTQTFINNFCDSFNFLSEEELIEADMSCCILHPLTNTQIALLKQHLASNSNYIDETGVAENSSRLPFTDDSYWLISLVVIIIVILLAIGVIVFILRHKEISKKMKEKKLQDQDELSNYISQARTKGYTDEQIKMSLKNVGWSDEQLNSYFFK